MAKFMTAYDFREQSFLVKKQSLKGEFFFTLHLQYVPEKNIEVFFLLTLQQDFPMYFILARE